MAGGVLIERAHMAAPGQHLLLPGEGDVEGGRRPLPARLDGEHFLVGGDHSLPDGFVDLDEAVEEGHPGWVRAVVTAQRQE
jgi:hypothetical protein